MSGHDPLDRLAAAFDEVAQRDARRARRGQRRSARRALLVVLALLVPATAIAAGTGLLSRDTVEAPRPADVPPEARVMAGTGRLLDVRAADPHGGPVWTLRLSRTRAGLRCLTAGQVTKDGRFGIVGLDGRFRRLPEAVADTCGDANRLAPWITSVRTFTGSTKVQPVTVVAALAGRPVRAAEVRRQDAADAVTAAVSRGGLGAVLAVVPGSAETVAPRLLLRFADGREDLTNFQRSPRTLVDDPYGRAPWRLEAQGSPRAPGVGGAQLAQSEAERAFIGRSLTPVASGNVDREGFVVAARRFSPGWRSPDPAGPRQPLYGWSPFARAVTLIWGATTKDVRRVEIRTPDGDQRSMTPVKTLVSYQPRDERRFNPYGFAFVLDGRTDPDAVAITIRFRDGRSRTVRGSTNVRDRLGPQPPYREAREVTRQDRAPQPRWTATGTARILRAADPAGGDDWLVRVRRATRPPLRARLESATQRGTCLLLLRSSSAGVLRTASGRASTVRPERLGQCAEDRWARGRYGALNARTPMTGGGTERPSAPLTALYGVAPKGSARVRLLGLPGVTELPVRADGAFLLVRPTAQAHRSSLALRGLTVDGSIVGGRRGLPPDSVAPDTSATIAVRVPDPDGGAPWAVHAGERGPQCAAVGQVVGEAVGVLHPASGTFGDLTGPRCGGGSRREKRAVVHADVQRLTTSTAAAVRTARRTEPGRTAVVLYAQPRVRRITIRTSRGARTLIPRGRAHVALAVWDGKLTGSLEIDAVLDGGRRWRVVRPVGG